MSTKLPALVPFDQDLNLDDLFGEYQASDGALSSGILSGYGVVSIKGKQFKVRHKGEDHIIRDANGDPARRLRVVIVSTGPNVSKTYYAGSYAPGSTEAPDCSSIDGIRPDIGASDPQASLCATCQWNQFGSKISENGKKSKACQDNKRLAVVPADDIANEAYGGPMLLRVPPASFKSLDALARQLSEARCHFYGAVVEISFDLDAEYPMLNFKALAKVASPAIAKQIIDQRNSLVTESIIFGDTSADVAAALPRAPAAKAIAKPAPAAQPAVAKAAPKAAPKPAPAPEPVAADEDVPEDAQDIEEAEEVVAPPPKAAPKAAAKAAPAVTSPAADMSLSDLLAGL